MEGINNSSARFDSFVQTLQRLAQGYWGLDKEGQKTIQTLASQLMKNSVTVTFGGHFSSGKSTLLNAALGRPLLPTLDYPETGAICAIRAGERDHVEVLTTNGRRTIDCTTAAIAQEIRRTTPTGSLNTKVLQVQQVNITLATRVIPRGTIWIDSPGINESPEMYERASEAARMGDILVWVLNSRQFLSLSEEEFLAEYIAECGPASVIFVSNAFLSRDTPEEWKAYHVNSFPAHLNKLRYRASFMAFTDQIKPEEVISVSARALLSYKGGDFGGRELRELLNSLSSCEYPRIRRVRLLQAAFTLRGIAAQIEVGLRQERERIKQAQIGYEQARQKTEQRKKRFTEEVESAITRFLLEWRASAHASEKNVLLEVNNTLQRDDTYSRILNDAFKNAAATGVERLLIGIAGATKLYEQKNLTSDDIATIRRMLAPLNVVVNVPNSNTRLAKGAATIAAGAAIGGIVPGIGHAVGALAGAAIAGVAAYNSSNKARREDIAATRSNITNTTQQVIASVEGKRAEVLKFIIEHCVSTSSIPPLDNTQLRLLERQFQAVSELANQAESLARGG